MSGKHSGVSARIRSDARFTFHVRCNELRLNVVIFDEVKSVSEVGDFCSYSLKLFLIDALFLLSFAAVMLLISLFCFDNDQL